MILFTNVLVVCSGFVIFFCDVLLFTIKLSYNTCTGSSVFQCGHYLKVIKRFSTLAFFFIYRKTIKKFNLTQMSQNNHILDRKNSIVTN